MLYPMHDLTFGLVNKGSELPEKRFFSSNDIYFASIPFDLSIYRIILFRVLSFSVHHHWKA